MAKKNDLAQQPGGGMPQDENRMMQAAQLADGAGDAADAAA